MTTSDGTNANADAQYARPLRPIASRRGIALWGGLLVSILVPLFVSLGNWQWNKAQDKRSRQLQREALAKAMPRALPGEIVSAAQAEAWRDRPVRLVGHFEPGQQILLDNRVHRDRAGFHVLTPLRLKGSDTRVLVNRGWVAGFAEHQRLPEVSTPGGALELSGRITLPGRRHFSLGTPATGSNPVWQFLDLPRYQRETGLPLQPFVVELAPESPAGFVRDWPRPDERIERHLGYAAQWYGFAAASLAIWLFLLLRRRQEAPPASLPVAGSGEQPGANAGAIRQ